MFQRNSVVKKGLAVEIILQGSVSRKSKLVFKLTPPGVKCHWYINVTFFFLVAKKDILASYQFAPWQVFWAYCKSGSYQNVPKEWIEGLAYKENQVLENQETRKSLENQRKSVTRKIRHRRKNSRG